jgi:hypothetical protein
LAEILAGNHPDFLFIPQRQLLFFIGEMTEQAAKQAAEAAALFGCNALLASVSAKCCR